jgi:hypothetical protein
MKKPKNILEIYRLLEKSNCKQCGEKTCLAFAQAVYMGHKPPGECPKLDELSLQLLSRQDEDLDALEKNGYAYLDKLKSHIIEIDLAQAAQRIGARFENNTLTLKVFGKPFRVNATGELSADIHINPWIAVPFLNHIIHGKGAPVSGKWVSFRELKDGKERYPIFQKRCEAPIKNVADTYPAFFDDLVHLFGGTQVEKQFQSDISVVLHILPKIPVMICYWFAEDGLESSLHIFFDKTADVNLDIDSIYTLTAGLAMMFGKLALRHGVA